MAGNGLSGFQRIWQATLYSVQGIKAAWGSEAAFRQEVLLCIVMVPGALWLGSTAVERALLIGVCLLVLAIELINSAIEAAIDRFGEERNILSGRAKDMGSAAVLVSLILVALTWGLIGYERIMANMN